MEFPSVNLEKMVSRIKPKIVSVLIILSVLTMLFSLPKILVGHAVSEQYPDVSGEWNINQIATYD